MTYIKEFVDRDNKIAIQTVFQMFKKLEARLNMLNRNIKNIKTLNLNF